MAIVSNPLIGHTRKKIGGVVFSNWKGINYIKAKPLTVANPNTDAQAGHRAVQTFLVSVARVIKGVIDVGFKSSAVKKSEFNAFVSRNQKNGAVVPNVRTYTFDPTKLEISYGTIGTAAIVTAVVDSSAGTGILTWSNAILPVGASLDDIPFAVFYDSTNPRWIPGIAATTRNAATATFATPVGWTVGNTVKCYLGFYNAASGESSGTGFLSTVIVA